jgi:hypothetical protein
MSAAVAGDARIGQLTPAIAEHIEDEVTVRTLRDGTKHAIVKVFWEPEVLMKRLSALGWRANVTPIEHGWFVLDATLA